LGGIRKVDRDDARFVADALDSRISGDRETLDRLASTSLVRLMAAAARVRALAAGWPPAIIAAAELESICRYGAKIVDHADAPTSNLVIFVDKLRGLIDEPARPTKPRNRAERRAAISRLSRDRRIVVDAPAFPV
jgi:hypothetical protein